MDLIINEDEEQENIMSYETFGGDSREYVFQPIKDNIILTFSTYDYWLIWKNLISNSINNLHTKIFWEMYRSNKLDFIEKTIDIKLIMNNNESNIYEIYEIIEIERKIYSNLNTYESSETVDLILSFKTSDIVPSDIINKPIIYVEYFIGDKYNTSFNGVSEAYFSPVLIHINIIPDIIYYEYKIDDYIVYQNKLAKVLSVTNDYTSIEIQIYNVITNNNNNDIYINITNNIVNVKQNDIIIFTSLDSLNRDLSWNNLQKSIKSKSIDEMFNITELSDSDTDIIIKNVYVSTKTVDSIVLSDSINKNSNTALIFNTYYDTDVIETFAIINYSGGGGGNEDKGINNNDFFITDVMKPDLVDELGKL
jgi:hypothetical protein